MLKVSNIFFIFRENWPQGELFIIELLDSGYLGSCLTVKGEEMFLLTELLDTGNVLCNWTVVYLRSSLTVKEEMSFVTKLLDI